MAKTRSGRSVRKPERLGAEVKETKTKGKRSAKVKKAPVKKAPTKKALAKKATSSGQEKSSAKPRAPLRRAARMSVPSRHQRFETQAVEDVVEGLEEMLRILAEKDNEFAQNNPGEDTPRYKVKYIQLLLQQLVDDLGQGDHEDESY